MLHVACGCFMETYTTCMLHADRSRSTQFIIVTEDQLGLQSTNPINLQQNGQDQLGDLINGPLQNLYSYNQPAADITKTFLRDPNASTTTNPPLHY